MIKERREMVAARGRGVRGGVHRNSNNRGVPEGRGGPSALSTQQRGPLKSRLCGRARLQKILDDRRRHSRLPSGDMEGGLIIGRRGQGQSCRQVSSLCPPNGSFGRLASIPSRGSPQRLDRRGGRGMQPGEEGLGSKGPTGQQSVPPIYLEGWIRLGPAAPPEGRVREGSGGHDLGEQRGSFLTWGTYLL